MCKLFLTCCFSVKAETSLFQSERGSASGRVVLLNNIDHCCLSLLWLLFSDISSVSIEAFSISQTRIQPVLLVSAYSDADIIPTLSKGKEILSSF